MNAQLITDLEAYVFTGIISEIGKVKSVLKRGASAKLSIACDKVGKDLDLGESVAVNGACLSIVKKNGALTFDVVGNTLKGTNLKRLKPADKVNLESALKLGDTLSGHMVSGHIDGERLIRGYKKTSGGLALDIGILKGDEKNIVHKGSVAIDGISLTIGEIKPTFFRIFIIPHTAENTTLYSKKIGDYVNVEFDMMAKYADRQSQKSDPLKDKLMEKGFM